MGSTINFNFRARNGLDSSKPEATAGRGCLVGHVKHRGKTETTTKSFGASSVVGSVPTADCLLSQRNCCGPRWYGYSLVPNLVISEYNAALAVHNPLAGGRCADNQHPHAVTDKACVSVVMDSVKTGVQLPPRPPFEQREGWYVTRWDKPTLRFPMHRHALLILTARARLVHGDNTRHRTPNESARLSWQSETVGCCEGIHLLTPVRNLFGEWRNQTLIKSLPHSRTVRITVVGIEVYPAAFTSCRYSTLPLRKIWQRENPLSPKSRDVPNRYITLVAAQGARLGKQRAIFLTDESLRRTRHTCRPERSGTDLRVVKVHGCEFSASTCSLTDRTAVPFYRLRGTTCESVPQMKG